jgi:hypothetical protein
MLTLRTLDPLRRGCDLILRTHAGILEWAFGKTIDLAQGDIVGAFDLAAQAHLPHQSRFRQSIPLSNRHNRWFALEEDTMTGGAFGVAPAAVQHVNAGIFQRQDQPLAVGNFDDLTGGEFDAEHDVYLPEW